MHMHYSMNDRMTTLKQFVQRSGGRAKAAILIGIAETTLWRWIEGRSQPRGLALRRLTDLGIEWEQGAAADKIARVAQVRPTAEAFAKNEEEMLLGMLSMSPRARVADVDLLRVRLGGLRQGDGKPAPMIRVARVVRRADA
jgi:DNA-binding transcriptional regulator YdaS (Cro superfamily)